jgi:hypothetical protein
MPSASPILHPPGPAAEIRQLALRLQIQLP